MTDAPTPEPTPPPFTTDDVVTLRMQAEKDGLDLSVWDQEMRLQLANFHRGHGQPAAAPDPGDKARFEASLLAASIPTATPEQRELMIADLLAAGMDPAKITEALEADGFTGVSLDPTVDERTANEKDFDRFFRAAAPTDIKVQWAGRIGDVDTATLAELNKSSTEWASAIGFTAELGASVIETAVDAGHAYTAMTEAERRLWVSSEKYDFERVCGGEAAAKETLAMATAVLHNAPRGFTDAILASGALHSANLILTLANQGKAMTARRAGL